MQYMQSWVHGLGQKQHEIIGRLSKEQVRAHKNIRMAGEGGVPEAQGTFAYNQGIQVQHNIQNYVSEIPVVGQAQQFMGHFSGGGSGAGQGREMSNVPGDALPRTGDASSYYGGQNAQFRYAPPSGPPPGPPASSFPSGPSMPQELGAYYASPPPPNAFPSPSDYGGYTPSTGPPPGGYDGGYTPPPGPPPPGGYGSPPPGGYLQQGGYSGYSQGGYPPPTNYIPPGGGYNQYGGGGGGW